MYWVTEYWLPAVARRGLVPAFKYAMMIDDDVPLPSTLRIPEKWFRSNVV
jgi:hypothetical protein